MLKAIHPYLSGDLLKVLDDMGHADQLLLVDRNYPAAASGRPVIKLASTSVEEVLHAILTVFPLDDFVEKPFARMEVNGDNSLLTPTQERCIALAETAEGREVGCGVLSRETFYQRATSAYAVVHTLEAAPYSCFILQKGVVFPE